MGFQFSRPVASRHPSIVHLQDYVGLPLTTVTAALRSRGLHAIPVATKPDESYDPTSVQVPTGTLLVVYNCENYYVTQMIYHNQPNPGRTR
jgi:hypothetical protein